MIEDYYRKQNITNPMFCIQIKNKKKFHTTSNLAHFE